MDFKCEYCGTILKTLSSLNYHKKTAKFCILGRCEDINTNENKQYKCELCDNIYNLKNSYNKHYKLCLEKPIHKKYLLIIEELKMKEQELKMKEQECDKLHKTIKELASKPTSMIVNNTNNTNSNNTNTNSNNKLIQYLSPLNLDEKRVEEILREKFTYEYLWGAQEGLAKFCVDHILKDEEGKLMLVCTDPARNRFKHKDTNNNIQEDIEARNVIKKLSDPVKNVTKEKYNKIMTEIDIELEEMKTKNIDKDKDNDRRNLLNFRKEKTPYKMADIQNFSDNKNNQHFLKELGILTNI